ncbi:MAG TPA: CopD family protein [Solirubrobacterales bacterium]|nr:CopD family protein [Solirubrobacterales bacterium]
MRRSLTLAAALAVAVALLAPASALAHAQLEGTVPARGAVVKQEPPAVIFRFDEPVEGNFGAVRVYDAGGDRVDEGDAFHPDGEGPRLGVHLKPGLADGSYTATYRVVSADGHIVSSGFVFSIGKTGKAPAETVSELTAGSGSGPVTETAFGIARGLQYTAIALAVGGLAFLMLAWLPALEAVGDGGGSWRRAALAFTARLRRVFLLAAALGVLSAAAGVVLEGAEAAGISGFSALKESIVRETLETKFGTIWGLAVLAWIVFGLLAAPVLRPAQRRGRGAWPRAALLTVPLVFVVLVPALSGHGSTQSPVALNFPVNAIHVGAMGVWLGGLAALLFVAPRGTRELEPADRGRLLAAALSRFSQVALIAVGAILVTGLIQAYVYVRHLDDLISTGYGRAVLIKFCLLMVLIEIGAYNRRRSVPRLNRIAAGGESPGRAGLILRRALRAEVALLAIVIGVTAALASYAPPVTAQGGPFSAESTVGPIQLEMSVEPATVGANEIHLYLFDAKSGAPYEKVKQLTVAAALPEKSISLPLEPQLAGPGHYTIPGALLNAGGDWRLTVTMRVSAFDEFTKTVEVPVR